MKAKASEFAEAIEREAKEKYSAATLLEELKDYNPGLYMEIVEFFKDQGERHPYLEAFEVYPLVVESVNGENPSREEIRGAMDRLLDMEAR